MVREFKLPDVGEGVAEGELVSWQVEEGDPVTEDQAVAEVETDKAIVEIPSPVNGSVRELLAEEGEVVPVGNVLLTFNVDGEDDEAEETTTESAESEETTDSQDDVAQEPNVSEGTAEETKTPEGRVFAAPSARRLARELGVDIASVDGTGPSGRVSEHDVRTAAESGAEAEAGTETTETETVENEPTADSGTSRRQCGSQRRYACPDAGRIGGPRAHAGRAGNAPTRRRTGYRHQRRSVHRGT